MKGTLVSDSGAEGADFVIDGVDAARSYAAVQATPDEVSSHMKVVLRPITKNRASIQRRALGTAKTGDVESTARAGVASASSRLPHLDAIQRAFGKHDVSGVRAHVGGEAAVASASLGARAYAMGNDVAFASSPDLHTAAHEAAHVVQQRNGLVSFAGVGPADDAHERHADQVADAVVAGNSAEALLDDAVGYASARSEGAVQLKRAATPMPGGASPDQLRFDVIRLSLQNARREIEKWDGARDPSKVIFDTRAHLAEAIATLAGLARPAQLQVLHPQMEETTHAIYEVVRMHGDFPPVTQLLERTIQLRTLLGLDPDPLASYSKTGAAKSPKNSAESDVLAPVMELVRLEAEAAYEQLVDIDVRKASDKEGPYKADERDSVIAAVTGRLQHHVVYAHSLLDEHPAVDGGVKMRVAAASAPIQQIWAWIFARENNAKMLSLIDRVMYELDALRATVGLGSLVRDPVSPPAQASSKAAGDEAQAVKGEWKRLDNAIAHQFEAFTAGAGRFSDYAKLTPPPPKASFWEELAKGILISVIGNVVGPAVGALVKANARTMTELSLGLIAGSTTDSVQALAGKIADDAFVEAASVNDLPRNVALFTKGLVLTQAECVRVAQDQVTKRVQAKSISAAELVAMREDIDKSSAQQVELMTFQRAAHGFALLTAQLGLDVKGDDKVSAMDGYFGEPMSGGDRFGETRYGSKLGTMGVGRLQITLFAGGRFRIEKFALNGMIGDLARAVLAQAGDGIDKIGLPIELEIEPNNSGRDAHAFLAIDERGQVRATRGWELMHGTFDGTPEKLWQSVRRTSIPTSVVEKG
jgi:hypothetical protein